jgi:hypothetical protein
MEKFFTAVLLTIAIFSYRTVLPGTEPGGGREAQQLQQMATVLANLK